VWYVGSTRDLNPASLLDLEYQDRGLLGEVSLPLTHLILALGRPALMMHDGKIALIWQKEAVTSSCPPKDVTNA